MSISPLPKARELLCQIRKAPNVSDLAQILPDCLAQFARTDTTFVIWWASDMPFHQELSLTIGISAEQLEEFVEKLYAIPSLSRQNIKKIITESFPDQEKVYYRFLQVNTHIGVFVQIGQLRKNANCSVQDLLEVFMLKVESLVLKYQLTYEVVAESRKAQTNYRLLAENTKDLVCLHNPEGDFLYVSPSSKELLGYNPEELIGTSHHTIFHAEDVIGLKAGYKKIKRHTQKYVTRYRLRHKEGHYLWFETLVTSVESSRGETQNMITSSREITQRIKTETKLKENISFMNTLLETIPIPVFYKHINGTYLNCNRRFAQKLGLRKIDIIGHQASDIFPHEQAKEYLESDSITLESNEYQQFEVTFINREQNMLHLIIYKDLFRNTKHEPQGIIGAMLDISEQKIKERQIESTYRDLLLTEEELRQNAEELHASNEHLTAVKHKLELALKREKETQAQLIHQGKMASIGLLTAGIAHEINNPLTFITGGIETLEQSIEELNPILEKYDELSDIQDIDIVKQRLQEISELKEEEEYEETREAINSMISSIKEGARRTTEIVRGLKTFSGGKNEAFRPADLHEGLDSTLVLLRNKLKRRITVIKEYQTNLPWVECHIGQINQVFMNLLANASESIQDDGTITIRTSAQDNFICIRIADTGVGMSPETQEKLFEPFYTTKGTRGTGLGLAISYGIIEKHNGTIQVQSDIGKGSEFILHLPISIKNMEPKR